MQRIPFSTLPDFSELFCDYVTAAPAALRFFAGDPHRPGDLLDQAARVAARPYPRKALADILLRQNTAMRAGAATLENIERLRSPDTVAVVTGQQVGLFGGPIYTVYKTLTAIRLCHALRAQLGPERVVPVFWLETEDHDLAEANHTTMLNDAGAPVTYTYAPAGPGTDTATNRGSVGALMIDDGIDAVLAAVDADLPNTEFHEPVMQMLRSCYRPGVDFGAAFGTLMQELFAGEGLVLLNPLDREIKQLLAPVFRRELETSPRVSEEIISQTALVEERYHAQVKARSINMFMQWKGGRYGVDPRKEHGDYWLKGTRQYFSRAELLTMLDTEPERFSPNVVLRPICQDAILPTVAYIGGPGEIAYFAQFKSAYAVFDVPMPLIYPRASITLLEPRTVSVLDRLRMSAAEYLAAPNDAARQAVQALSPVDLGALFATARTAVSDAFDALLPTVQGIDKTLAGALTTARDKATQPLDVLAKKTTDAAVRANETVTRQVEKLHASLYPHDEPQERVLNVLTFLNKYGKGVLPAIGGQISLDTSEHQVITVEAPAKGVAPVPAEVPASPAAPDAPVPATAKTVPPVQESLF